MPDTAPLRNKTRRVKDHILDKYLKLADRVEKNDELSENEKARYWEMTMIFAKSVLPRTQEVTGEDGEAIKLSFDPVFKPNGTTSETEAGSAEQGTV